MIPSNCTQLVARERIADLRPEAERGRRARVVKDGADARCARPPVWDGLMGYIGATLRSVGARPKSRVRGLSHNEAPRS